MRYLLAMLVIAIALLGSFFGSAASDAQEQAAQPITWEYKVLTLTPRNRPQVSSIATNLYDADTEALEETLNKLGAQGWEVCGLDDQYHALLKRPKK